MEKSHFRWTSFWGAGQWHTDNGNGRTDYGVILVPQFQRLQFGSINFKYSEIPRASQIIDWRDDLSRNLFAIPVQRNGDISVLGQCFRVYDNMERGNNPPIGIDDESSSMENVGINLNNRIGGLSARFDIAVRITRKARTTHSLIGPLLLGKYIVGAAILRRA